VRLRGGICPGRDKGQPGAALQQLVTGHPLNGSPEPPEGGTTNGVGFVTGFAYACHSGPLGRERRRARSDAPYPRAGRSVGRTPSPRPSPSGEGETFAPKGDRFIGFMPPPVFGDQARDSLRRLLLFQRARHGTIVSLPRRLVAPKRSDGGSFPAEAGTLGQPRETRTRTKGRPLSPALSPLVPRGARGRRRAAGFARIWRGSGDRGRGRRGGDTPYR
jgi:hypothetical protein